jgi:hypothetical protein
MYEDKFIGFVDILGFKALVERFEGGGDSALSEEYILELLDKFGSSEEEDFARYGPTICPNAPYTSRNLNFRVTQISDCAVISAEVSPAGLINLVHHCYKIAFRFLRVAHLCRGYITRGNIYHTDTRFFGTGYVRAYEHERDHKVVIFQKNSEDTGTPFIEIDPHVCDYVIEQLDGCVKTVFRQLTESDGKSTAISPFFALKTMLNIAIDQDLDAKELKDQVEMVCDNIRRLLSQLENAKASASIRGREKIEHVERKLHEVLALKDKHLEMLDFLSQPLSPRF